MMPSSLDQVATPMMGGVGIFVAVSLLMLWVGRRMERKARLAGTTGEDGKLVGVVGLPGAGKTSFIVANYALPALKAGKTVVTNFDVYPDASWPGRWVKFKTSTFGEDLLGIGSTLNVDPETGVPMSGWFIDTACTCGKDHDSTCVRPYGDIPAGTSCCKGFRDRRLCGCNSAVVVVDEAQSFIPANGSTPLPIDLLTWFTMVRKNHIIFIWATQYWKWIHTGVRRLTPQGIGCDRDVLYTDRIARLYDVDPDKCELRPEVLTTFKYKPAEVAGRWYDSGEVIVPSSTAYSMLGQMSKRTLLAGAASEGRAAASQVVFVSE